MLIFPSIDLFEGKAVRLLKGDYAQMTVYSEDPLSVARDYVREGAAHIHLVDLEGARDGTAPHLDLIRRIVKETGLIAQVGGGIRNMETVDSYLENGVERVILGTAALSDPAFLEAALRKWKERIAVGVDLKDGHPAIRGWTETADIPAMDFLEDLQRKGVQTVICTDISRDGAMHGTNRALYRDLSERLKLHLIASGGVSSMADIMALRDMGLYGAIIGKAYYTGAIRISEAVAAT